MSYTPLTAAHTFSEDLPSYSNENWRQARFWNTFQHTSDFTAWSDDASGRPRDFYRVDASSADVTVTLPGASGGDAEEGRVLIILRLDSGANGHTVTITADGSDTINNGAAGGSITLDSRHACVALRPTGGTVWDVVWSIGTVGGVRQGHPHRSIDDTDSPYTAGVEENLYCDATSNPITVNLPSAVTSNGKTYRIKKTDASANAVTIDANASETIDGATTLALSAQYDAATICCDGAAWHIFATV